MKKIKALWRLSCAKSDAQRFYEATAYHLAKASAVNHDLAYALHKVGIFGGPRIEILDRRYLDDVVLHEKENCVIIKDGFIYRLTREAV